MFIAEAVRLAAIEVLTPTANLASGDGLPTRAGRNVFDSRAASIGDLNDDLAYTPTLALYTSSSRAIARADVASEDDRECEVILEVIAELSVRAKPEEEDQNQDEFVDAMAGSDPDARLVLAGLCGQVEFLLLRSQAGYLFRKLVLGVRRIDLEPFALPHLGLRWHRTTMRMVLGVPDDRYDVGGGLPEPLRGFAEQLPDDSYAKAKLIELAAYFTGDEREPLHLVTISPPGGEPIASTDLEP